MPFVLYIVLVVFHQVTFSWLWLIIALILSLI